MFASVMLYSSQQEQKKKQALKKEGGKAEGEKKEGEVEQKEETPEPAAGVDEAEGRGTRLSRSL